MRAFLAHSDGVNYQPSTGDGLPHLEASAIRRYQAVNLLEIRSSQPRKQLHLFKPWVIPNARLSTTAGLLASGSLLYVNWPAMNRPTSEAFGRSIDREDQEDECEERKLETIQRKGR
jgi:hypothetical protein